MGIPALTNPLSRALAFGIQQVASVDNIETPQTGDINMGALADGSIAIKDHNDKVTIIGGGVVAHLANSLKGAKANIEYSETELTLSGATTTATGLYPAKCYQLGVVARVTQAITGASGSNIGDGSDADRYGANVGVAKDTVTSEANFTASPVGWSASAGNVVCTALTSDYTGGKIRLTAFYLTYDGAAA